MKRREFIISGTTGAVAAGLTGCAGRNRAPIRIKQELTPVDMERTSPRPNGTMPMGELGKTGIRVSKFGFGSHMRKELMKFTKEREWMVREAYDLGVNLFDVYDIESSHYQYEPMGRYLEPIKNRVVISITMWPDKGLTIEQELVRDMKLFRRDYIDLVRLHAWKREANAKDLANQSGHKWEWWESLFKLKQKGYIRAVGIPIHLREDMIQPLAELPLDYVILPFNFYHNWTWSAKVPDDSVHKLVPKLRRKGMGIISMKPFAGDHLVAPFMRLTEQYDESRTVNYAQACLRYVINSGLNVDATLGGMYNPFQVHENIAAFFKPQMSSQERKVLLEIRDSVRGITSNLLPEHYQFLEKWV